MMICLEEPCGFEPVRAGRSEKAAAAPREREFGDEKNSEAGGGGTAEAWGGTAGGEGRCGGGGGSFYRRVGGGLPEWDGMGWGVGWLAPPAARLAWPVVGLFGLSCLD
jgi:hypothetical protein